MLSQQGVTNISVFEYLKIFFDTNICWYHISILSFTYPNTFRYSFVSFSLQIRMSQAYRMGFDDISRDSPLHRLFIQKYILASSGEDDGDSISGAKENLDGVRIQKALL